MYLLRLRTKRALGLAFGLALSIVTTTTTTSGCAAKQQSNTATVATQSDARAQASACDRFAGQLCGELGAKTEACMSLRSAQRLFGEKACEIALGDLDGAIARARGLRADCEELTQKLCEAIGPDTTACEEVKRDLPEVPIGQCPVLLRHYPELVAQLRTRDQQNRPLSKEAWTSLLAGAPAALGPETAKVTIVEFSDFQCPYCAQAHETVRQLRERYPEQVRVVFRHFPLAFHEHARLAAQAALAAHAQGKFWPYHDRLFERQNALDRKSLDTYAQDLGLDVALFKKSLDENAYDAQVEADLALGRSVRVDGTPTMFINGKRAENAVELDAVVPLIDAALAAK
jgi:protein-disulfide isomerase